jgi:hypothetical protein
MIYTGAPLKKFGSDSGFEATHRFTIEEQLPERLSIVIERPDLYTITCNGKTITATKDSWWLDKAFGKIDVTEAAKLSEIRGIRYLFPLLSVPPRASRQPFRYNFVTDASSE